MPATLRICKGEIQVITPDLKFAVTEDRSSTLHFWDIEKDSPVYDFEFEDHIRLVELSPDGKSIAGTGGEIFAEAAIWNWEDGVRKSTHTFEVTAKTIYWLPNGKSLLALWNSGNITRIDVEKECTIPLTSEADKYSDCYCDGKYLIICQNESVDLLNIITNKREKFLDAKVCLAAVSPNSQWGVLVESGDANLQIFDLKTKEKVLSLDFETNKDSRPHISPNGKFLLASCEKRIRLWKTKTWEIVQDWVYSQNVIDIEWSRDSQKFAVIYGGILTVEPVNRS